MDATLKGVVRLLAGTDVEARCAALVVLTHLRAAESGVIAAVAAALGSKNAVVRDFAIGYFEQVQPGTDAAPLLPLLDSDDDATRTRVTRILAGYGAATIGAVKRLLDGAPRRRLNAIIDLCAQVHSAAALDVLLELMVAEDFDVQRAACDALVTAVPTLDGRARTEVSKRARQLIAAAKGKRAALVAGAKLFGALAEPAARAILFPLLDAREPAVVRTHALAALGQCLRGQKLTAAEIRSVLSLLNEDDEAGILRPAVRLLDDQSLDRSVGPQLQHLTESPQPVVKRFAVQKLGEFDSGAVVKTLIGYLTDDSFARRDQASASLKKMPAARTALMKEMLGSEDERQAWALTEILLTHDRAWKRDTVSALIARLEDTLESRPDRLYTAYFHLLQAIAPEALSAHVRARAERLRKKHDYAAAAKWLSLLRESPAFDAEAQWSLAVAELKSHKHPLGSAGRRSDPALDLLRGLTRSSFPVAERLRKERAFTPDDLFHVAFNLAEGSADEKAVARELLDHVAQRFGRTKTGKAAKNKLRLLGNE